ncbi:MAG: hypothetical protein WC325_13355 [Candidatus Bathyarchaeia archaeon]
MGVIIRKTDFGFSWQPDNGKRDSISEEQIFPKRLLKGVIEVFAKNPNATVWFRFFMYDQNKILFLSQEKT